MEEIKLVEAGALFHYYLKKKIEENTWKPCKNDGPGHQEEGCSGQAVEDEDEGAEPVVEGCLG
jgi:hypothetical protein